MHRIDLPNEKIVDRDNYVEPSPIAADNGEKVGRLPGSISLDDLRALGHPESPIKAIRAKCLDCSGHNDAEVRKCVAIGCALWPFRMGRSPFYGKGAPAAATPQTGGFDAADVADSRSVAHDTGDGLSASEPPFETGTTERAE